MKVSKKDERLARALVLKDCTEYDGLMKALGTAEIIKRVETLWGDHLDTAIAINQCLNMTKNDVLDGDTNDILTAREYDEMQDMD